MHEYDIALKGILMRLPGSVPQQLTGFAITRWHNAELPQARNPRLGLLGETADGRLVHIELQSTNDPDMALRMAEYAWAIYRKLAGFRSSRTVCGRGADAYEELTGRRIGVGAVPSG
jgi:hypothetical protein